MKGSLRRVGVHGSTNPTETVRRNTDTGEKKQFSANFFGLRSGPNPLVGKLLDQPLRLGDEMGIIKLHTCFCPRTS